MTAARAKYLKDYTVPPFLVDEVELVFELNGEQTIVTSTAQYKRNGQNNADLVLNGEHQKLLQVSLDGQVLAQEKYQLTEETLTLTELPEQFTLTIKSQIDPVNNTALEGLYLSAGAYCTQCEAEGFRRITYYQDRPDVLAKFTTHIIADRKNFPYLLSNGNKVNEVELEDGRSKVTWFDPYKKPCYLFALVAGDFDVLRDVYTTKNGRNVTLELFVDKGNLKRAPHAMTSLKQAMAWDESRFNLEYDLDIYMIVAVDFFNMGAMENKGLNVFNSKCVLADSDSATDNDYLSIESIVGHEYFHNWTGNRVTCRDWFQLSLKEGLTVFRDQEFSMDLGSRAVNRIQQVKVMREHQFAEDASPMSHPIRPESVIEMNNFYTVTVYDKGAEVIRMMHSILGEDRFQQGMQLYFSRHDGQAVTCDDFVAAMEDASGVDLTQFRLWYSQSGTPVVKVEEAYLAAENKLKLTIKQSNPPTADQKIKQPLHIPINIAFFNTAGEALDVSGGAEQVVNLTEAEQTFEFSTEVKPYFSLLRDFSAPVKLVYQYSDDALACLIPAESSQYTKWELMQNLYIKHITQGIKDSSYQYPSIICDILAALIQDASTDKALLAEILKVPSFASIMETMDTVDVDAVIQARKSLEQFIIKNLNDQLVSCYNKNHAQTYEYHQDAIAKRALANSCLLLLAASDENNDVRTIIETQYQNSDNMTDTLAAMQAASLVGGSLFKDIMQSFDEKWRGDALVMDKWFSVHARCDSEQILQNLDELQNHPDFNWNNPNRVRALIAQFAMFNHSQFHHKTGRGYQYLGRVIERLNTSNPQIAARMITPLIQFKKLDEPRQVLIKAELSRLFELDNLSKDLYEKISKTLDL
ncbi:aminopeptidase N [Catenovulum sediminis]|uniref:aminopeptidase N n=1 Tax=Catenovulum sediminis TaxID=1740262 RepID=UPI00117FD5FA|nr:aminopeptidase N [Catenovulum sediminis]